MKYMGSKSRIAKDILPIMLSFRKPFMTWVEPFVGGGNIIDKVTGNRLGGDNNFYTIDALLSIQCQWMELPRNNQEFTESMYHSLLQSSYPHKGYAGYAFSYGGKWMGGWRRDKEGRRDYVNESFRNAEKQSILFTGVDFVQANYWELVLPDNSLIYCDPPYYGVTSYGQSFDHLAFWDWCRCKGEEGHTVFCSEYSAPSDFECLWSKEIVSSLTRDTGGKTGVERLFRYVV